MKITDEEGMKSKEQRQKNNRTMKQMKNSQEMKVLLKEYKPDQGRKNKKSQNTKQLWTSHILFNVKGSESSSITGYLFYSSKLYFLIKKIADLQRERGNKTSSHKETASK